MMFVLAIAFVILLWQIVPIFLKGIDVDNLVIAILALCIMAWSLQDMVCTPQAIDVYRGNTTLEITYRDSIPVDTIVVFK